MNNNFNYEFEIYQLNDDEPTYIVNNSPHLTEEFIEYLESIDIDIHTSIYKVTKL
jgi:hypothetical protein|tara:strand:- start:360 stop:524 length:165 start_codon:yes stop_codon:yes gene_type:complete